MTLQKLFQRLTLLLAGTTLLTLGVPVSAWASPMHGSYEGVLFVGSGRIEGVMMNIDRGGNMVFVSEEGDNSDIIQESGLVPNDIETTALGAWRLASRKTLEFGVIGYRSGSGLCIDITDDDPPKLPSCSFVFTGRLSKNNHVRGQDCDLGGKGRLARRSIDGFIIEDVGIDIDYCLRRITAEAYLNILPVPH